MWCGKCGISHLHRMNHVDTQMYQNHCGVQPVGVDKMTTLKVVPVEKGTSMIQICKKCEGEGHTQENCTATGVPCYKCGKMGHLAGECSQMGRFALRHQIYDPPPKEARPFCQHCKEMGHLAERLCKSNSSDQGRKAR